MPPFPDFRVGIVAAVRDKLLQDTDLAAAFGSGQAARIYPSILPQPPAFPSITIQVVGGHTVVSHGGYSGLMADLVQIDTYSKTQVEADSVARRIRIVIDGWRGTVKQLTVPGAFRRRVSYSFDADAEAYRVSQDFRIWQQEG